jgi:hypothetical protein
MALTITHFTLTHEGAAQHGADRQAAADSDILFQRGDIDVATGTVTIPSVRTHTDTEYAVALAAQMAATSIVRDEVVGGRLRAYDPAERRVTLWDGERVVATATALENPATAEDRLADLTEQIQELTRRRQAVLQITDPAISRVRQGRGVGVSDRTAAGATGYSHTQIATLRGQPLAVEAIRWRAIDLLAQHGLALPAGGSGPRLEVILRKGLYEETPRVVLTTTGHVCAPAEQVRAIAGLLQRAVDVLTAGGLTVEVRQTVTVAGVETADYWLSTQTA